MHPRSRCRPAMWWCSGCSRGRCSTRLSSCAGGTRWSGRRSPLFSFVNCMWLSPASGVRMSLIAVNLLALGFIVLAVAQSISSWSSDLVEGRRRVRVFIVSAAALYGGLNAVLQISMSGGGATEVASTVNSAALAAVVAAISIAMMRVDGAGLFPAAPEVQFDASEAGMVDSSAADQKLVDALLRLMVDARIY